MLLICFIDLRNNLKEFAHSVSFYFFFYSYSYTRPNLIYCITQRTPKCVVCFSSCPYLLCSFPLLLAILHGFNFRFVLLCFVENCANFHEYECNGEQWVPSRLIITPSWATISTKIYTMKH